MIQDHSWDQQALETGRGSFDCVPLNVTDISRESYTLTPLTVIVVDYRHRKGLINSGIHYGPKTAPRLHQDW